MSDKHTFRDNHDEREQRGYEDGRDPAEQQPEQDNAPEGKDGERGGNEQPSPHEVIQKLNEENAKLKDQFVRTVAEMDNLRKRTAREISDAKTYAASSFAKDMLSVADNLSRALHAISSETQESDAKLKSLAEGVAMTERNMMSALHRHGVRKIEAVGKKFDPHLHEAIFKAPDKSVPHNTVKQEVEAGYMIGDRVLRAAKVGVAEGGEKPGETEAKSAAPAEGENEGESENRGGK